MPDLAAQLARDLADMRTRRGVRRQETRERLNAVDEGLRRQRNLEALRLADLASRLRGGRGDPADLKAAVEASTARLAELDRRIVQAMIASEPRSAAPEKIATGSNLPDPAAAAEAKATMRARLTVASATLAELLPEGSARQVHAAITAAIRRYVTKKRGPAVPIGSTGPRPAVP